MKIDHSEGKDFLFVSPDERMVEVFCSGYVPLKIFLNDLGVHLKSGASWSLKVIGDKKMDMLHVTFQIQPADAALVVDGKNYGADRTVQLSVGDHSVRVAKAGFTAVEKKLASRQRKFFLHIR